MGNEDFFSGSYQVDVYRDDGVRVYAPMKCLTKNMEMNLMVMMRSLHHHSPEGCRDWVTNNAATSYIYCILFGSNKDKDRSLMHVIFSSPWYTYLYMKNFIIERDNLSRSIFLHNPIHSGAMSKQSGSNFDLHPWPEAVQNILKCPVTTTEYMKLLGLKDWAPGLATMHISERAVAVLNSYIDYSPFESPPKRTYVQRNATGFDDPAESGEGK